MRSPFLDVERNQRALLVAGARGPTSDDLAFHGFSLAVSGIDDPALVLPSSSTALDHNLAVVQRTELHVASIKS